MLKLHPQESFKMLPISEITIQQNVRKQMDPDELEKLANSITANGILQPLRVVHQPPHYILVDGHRRLKAAQMAGQVHVPAYIVQREWNEAEHCTEQIISNCQRENLTPLELARALDELKQASGWTATDLAKQLGFSLSKVSRHLAMLTWSAGLIEKVESGELPLSTAAEIAKLDPSLQATEIQKALRGEVSRDQMVGARKRQSNTQQVTTKSKSQSVQRITAPLGVARSFMLQAPQLDIESFIQTLQELLDKARKYRTQGLELDTFIKVLKDTSKTEAC